MLSAECRILFILMLNVVMLSVVAPKIRLVRKKVPDKKHSSLFAISLKCLRKKFYNIDIRKNATFVINPFMRSRESELLTFAYLYFILQNF
jgi:hypothetical protein